jgi:hypothetical protein
MLDSVMAAQTPSVRFNLLCATWASSPSFRQDHRSAAQTEFARPRKLIFKDERGLSCKRAAQGSTFGDLRFEEIHGNGWIRTEILRGLPAAGCAFIRSPRQTSLFLDPNNRTFMYQAVDQLPGRHDRPVEHCHVASARDDAAPRPRKLLTLYSLRAEVEFDPSERLRPFAGEALKVVVGVDSADSILAPRRGLGFPVAGSTWLGESSEPAVRWRIGH